MQNRFTKSVLGVSKYTCNYASNAELGMFPLILSVIHRVIKFYVRLNIMNDNTLVKKSFFMMKNEKNRLVKMNYVEAVENILKVLKIRKFNLNFKTTNLTHSCSKKLLQALKDKFISIFKMRISLPALNIANRKKLRTYYEVKKIYRLEPYLYRVEKNYLRQALSKIRLSNNNLPIELGRKMNIALGQRLCGMCNLKEIGDELHFFTICQNLELKKLRNTLFNTINASVPQFKGLPNREKMLYLLAGNDLDIIYDICIFIKKGLEVVNMSVKK